MKLYTCTSFEGHYPIGTAAVVVANDRAHAVELMNAALAEEGLPPVKETDLEQISASTARAYILNNGNY